MPMPTMTQMWLAYAQSRAVGQEGSFQRKEAKRAFFSGFAAAFRALGPAAYEALPEEDARLWAELLDVEIRAFEAAVQGRAPVGADSQGG